MDISVGICACNEGKNIRNLLEKLLKISSKSVNIKEIIVVSDGSRDDTNNIIRLFRKKSRKIKALIRKKRTGKVSAINQILSLAKSNIIVLESADSLPKQDAYEKLLKPFKNPNTGITCCHITPSNKGNDFMTFLGRFMYKLHHEISLKIPKYGELIAFRKVIRRMPSNAVDEEFIAMLILGQGYKGIYCPDAIVYNKTPTNMSDFLKQRRRVYAGHLVMKRRYKFRVPTVSNSSVFFQILRDKKYMSKHFIRIMIAVCFELYGRFLGFVDVYLIKRNHTTWDIACSTKNPQC